jgi:hypothetical protein
MNLLSPRNPTRKLIFISVGLGIILLFSLNFPKNSVFFQSPDSSPVAAVPLNAPLFLTNLSNDKITIYLDKGASIRSDWRENVTIKEFPYARARFDSRNIVI